MKKINIFCFGFGQVAKNFVYNLNKTYDVNLAITSRDKTQKKKIYGINYISYHFLDDSFDIAIRVGPLKDSEFIAQFLLSSDSILCASEKYLKHVKTDLTTLYQIDQCDFLSYQSDKSNLRLLNSSNKEALELKVNNRMSSSSTTVLRQAAVEGLGIACLPMISVKKEILSSELIHLFEGTVGVKRNEIYMVYPSKVHLSKKMKLFMEHLKQKAMKIS